MEAGNDIGANAVTYPRSISPAGMREMFAPQSGHVWLSLVVFMHNSLPAPIRLCNNMQDVAFNGNVYTALAFEVALSTDEEDTVPTITLRVDNVSQELVGLLRTISDRADVSVEIVRVPSTGGAIVSELGPVDFKLLSFDLAMDAIDITLGPSTDPLNQPATRERFVPAIAPGLF